MDSSTAAMSTSAGHKMEDILEVISFARKHPSKEGNKAIKGFILNVGITLAIVFLVMFPLAFLLVFKLSQAFINPPMPEGAVREVRGHISKYTDTFFYTDDSKKYEFDLSEYSDSNSYEKGEIISVYLDRNNRVFSIDHVNQHFEVIGYFALYFLSSIILLMAHALIGRKTYCRSLFLYVGWYNKEIAPLKYREHFEELAAGKIYYDVTEHLKHLNSYEKKRYRIARTKSVIYSMALLVCIGISIALSIKFEIGVNSKIFIIGTYFYVGIFYFLIKGCDRELERIRDGKYINTLSND